MIDATKTTRELLTASDLFGFDTACWARGLINGRRAAARRGIKAEPTNFQIDEQQLLNTLNAPAERTAAADAVQTPLADDAAGPADAA